MAWRDTGKNFPQVEEALNLKICDLCGALNLASDIECVICRWHGHFDRRPEVVRIALELHMQREVASDLRSYPEELLAPEDRGAGFLTRLAAWWNAIRRRMVFSRF